MSERTSSYSTAHTGKGSRKMTAPTMGAQKDKVPTKDTQRGKSSASKVQSSTKDSSDMPNHETLHNPQIIVEDPGHLEDEEAGSQGTRELILASTPETAKINKPKSDSSLLRIRTQIKAASQAKLDSSVRAASEPQDVDDHSSSFVSEASVCGGGAFHDMPRLANELLQRTKSRLDESKNLNRDIREAVSDGLHGLYQMILRLADSRNRHIAEKERTKAHYEHVLARQEAQYSKALLDLQQNQTKEFEALKEINNKTFKEAEAARWLVYETNTKIKEQACKMGTIENKLNSSVPSGKEPPTILSERFSNVEKALSSLANELRKSSPPGKQPLASTTLLTGSHTVGGVVKSYAEALMKPRHAVVVESVDPRLCGADIERQIKDSVDVVELGVGINSVKKLKNQRVLFSCETEQGSTVLSKAITESDSRFTVSRPVAKKPQLRLIGVIKDMSTEKIEEGLIKQNEDLVKSLEPDDRKIKLLRRTKSRNNELCNCVLEVSPGLWNAIRDRRIRLGYQMVLAVDQSPVRQCFRCMGFGHTANVCKGEEVCGYCAQSHDTRTCTHRQGPPQCNNCKTALGDEAPHPAYSTECPIWRKWDKIARTQISYL